MSNKQHGNKVWRNFNNALEFRGNNETRRVSFKPNKQNFKKDNRKDWAGSLRAHLQDEDVDMGGNFTGGRSNNNKRFFKGKRGNRSGSPAPNFKRKLIEGPMGWYRITLPYGNKYDKIALLQVLAQEVAPLVLTPITWKVNGTVATFYVDEFKVADKLLQIDRQIQMPDGFQLAVRVHPGSPNVDVNAQLKDKIKLAMANRYNNVHKALDLTKFHTDPELFDCFCALFKPIVFMAVLDIIAENIPELEALNLNDNKINGLGFLKKMNEKLPNLKILHISNNKIRDLETLEPLVGLPIIELVLEGNPVCNKYKDKDKYVSEVRKRFPKVIKLDGVDLPPPIGFDIADKVPLPPKTRNFLINAESESIISRFVEQYYMVFESDDRNKLLEAYHTNATFSLTMSYPYGSIDQKTNRLDWYRTDSRNLIRVTDSDRRLKLLKQGHLSIVSFLKDMPECKHDIPNFTVDHLVFTPQMMSITLSGVFRELKTGSHRNASLRSFFRTLLLVPAGSGFCIINDMLHITNTTEEQAKVAFKTPIIVAPPPTPVNSPNVSLVPANVPDDVIKLQMIQGMAEQSGMNLEWSKKCLSETQWDFPRATMVFNELHKEGKVPSEAFIK